MKVYFYIRLIGNIDKYILDANYKNDDYMRVKKQQIENMSKSDMIKDIKSFNIKNWFAILILYIDLYYPF